MICVCMSNFVTMNTIGLVIVLHIISKAMKIISVVGVIRVTRLLVLGDSLHTTHQRTLTNHHA